MIKPEGLRWATHLTRMRERRSAYGVSMGRPARKRTVEKPSHRWNYNSKVDLQEVESGVIDWIDLAQDRDVAGSCKSGNKASSSVKYEKVLII